MRSRHRPILLWVVTALLAAPAAASESASPYAGWHERPIKALSAEQIDDLRSGRGMGLALPAELNGYPGPQHVLDLADELELTAEQRAETEALFEAMRAEAVRLGERIIEREAALDRLFASGEATEAAVRKVAGEIARLQGELRAVHLGAHLTMRDLLTPHQVARYTEIRGYGSTSHGHGHGGHAGHQ
jgi:Spy/CpxP family protein refolding chaperone